MTIDPRSVSTAPRPTPTTTPYWDALAAGRLQLQHCTSCERYVHYPRIRCPHCGGGELDWREVEPAGTVHTFTVAPVPTAPPYAGRVPQLIAIVELDCGVHVTSELVDVEPEAIRSGMAVRGVFQPDPSGVTLLRFAPV